MKTTTTNKIDATNYLRAVFYSAMTAFLLLSLAANMQAQNWGWARQSKTGLKQSGINGYSIATDKNGNVYIAGQFNSPNVTFGSFTLTNNGVFDIFVVKYDSSGKVLWAKQSGGTGLDQAYGITVDGNGNAFVVGTTSSTDFPVLNPGGGCYFQSVAAGSGDAFILELSSSGTPMWSTYYGGTTSSEYANSVTIDNSGNVIIVGNTGSSDFPVQGLGGAYNQSTLGGSSDGFILKMSANGTRLWATYFGGASYDELDKVTTDAGGNIITTGQTNSNDYPVTAGAYQPVFAGIYDADIAKFSASGSLLWSTYYGGSDMDYGTNLAIDGNNNIVVAGTTYSSDFPVSGGTFQNTYDAFIIKLDPSGTRMWSNFNGSGLASGIETVPNGNIYSMVNSISEIIIIESDPAGNFLATKSPAYIAAPIYGREMKKDLANNIYITGNFTGLTEFNFASDTLKTDSVDVFTVKLLTAPLAADSVWPGDANNDLVANNNDLLSLGLTWGDTGPLRPIQTIDWSAHSCLNWTNSTSGVNNKHDDCDGDGTVGFSDTTAIIQNYGLTHTLKLKQPENVFGNATLAIKIPSGNYNYGDVVTVPITLGTLSIPASNVYAVAFTINYPSTAVDPNTVSAKFTNSWMGNFGGNLAAIKKNLSGNNQIHIGITRNDHQNISGNGTICEMTIKIDNVSGIGAKMQNVYEYFTISDATLIDKDGNVIAINLQGDSVQPGVATGVKQINNSNSVSIYPNPASHLVYISGIDQISSIELFDLTGRLVSANIEKQNSNAKIDVSALDKGIYTVVVKSTDNIVYKKLQVN